MLSEEVTIKNLLKLEARVHRGGWDQPSIFAEVRQVLPNVIRLNTLPVTWHNNKSSMVLLRLGEDLVERPELVDKLFPEGLDDLMGLMLCDEGWAVEDDKHIEGVLYADNPHGKEIRYVMLMDLYGRVFHAGRARGEKPYALLMDPERYWKTGTFLNTPQAMVRILLAVAKQMRDGQRYVDALSALWMPLPDQGETRPKASNAT